jgi:hypothetical protein
MNYFRSSGCCGLSASPNFNKVQKDKKPVLKKIKVAQKGIVKNSG